MKFHKRKIRKKKIIKLKNRVIVGQKTPLGKGLLGEFSMPGPDISLSPPTEVTNPMVNLGCLNYGNLTDIVPMNISWPNNKIPKNYNSRNINEVNQGNPTPFQSSVYLTGNVDMYNISAIGSGYSNIVLSTEGLLWTLFPLSKQSENMSGKIDTTYYKGFIFGTSTSSRYPIGQLGYFTNNIIQSCTPFGSINPNSGINPGTNNSQPGLSPYSPGIIPGIQSLNASLHITTEQEVAIVVIKVAEEVARIQNPMSGQFAESRFIWLGYDAWGIMMTTANPEGPMAAQTYLSPQSITGSITPNNYQVIIPPNFPQVIYYKNQRRNVPIDTFNGLFVGNSLN